MSKIRMNIIALVCLILALARPAFSELENSNEDLSGLGAVVVEGSKLSGLASAPNFSSEQLAENNRVIQLWTKVLYIVFCCLFLCMCCFWYRIRETP